ncbi:ferredoxin reductase [Polyangium sp. 15x6]|uniref:ferredoxin reductase n=1 Tax=Polyangium sp. 15x6 TaxID=3042687 RepID=UPI00249B53E7|nr:ferredoxin reductase [Polyangium sp. 15x6]MDI3289681.1 ferredoxin reductase [Polyangium sp. 15x6]
MNTLATSAPRVARTASFALRAAQRVSRALLLDRSFRFWVDELAPVASRAELRACVLSVADVTHDVKTFVLAPRVWPGHLPGQWVPVEIEVDGIRLRRCYSISSPPNDPHVELTVKRVPGGRVSNWMHTHLHAGDFVRLGAPSGDFVLPEATPAKLLLLSGGSGATPLIAILRDLAHRRALKDVTYLHAARSRRDVLFARELARLSSLHPGLRVVLHLDDESPRLDSTQLWVLVPDLAHRETFLCGPTGMMDAVAPAFLGFEGRLHHERFVVAKPAAAAPGAGALIHLGRSKRSITTTGRGTLLDELEQAGERLEYGCRMGICNTCRCAKRSGVVENVLTGAISNEPDDVIRLCVSVARSDLTLAL